MIDLKNGEIILQNIHYRIKQCEVWFAVEGLGLFSTLEEASAKVGKDHINLMNLRPVPVAVAEQPGVYEAM